jgi:GNAT superfamily N-acetyltransferase
MTLELRRATDDDVVALAALHLATVSFAYRDWFPPWAAAPAIDHLERLWREDVDTAHAVLVAIAGGVVVGSAVARASGDLARLHVLPSHWSRGIGSSLHDAALSVLRERGHERAGLWVIEQNARARRLYERNGWALDPTAQLVEVDVVEVRYWRSLG